MLVREVMSDPVVTVDVSASLDRAVERMLAHGVGSLVVVETNADDRTVPFGILTATDVLRTAAERDVPLSDCDAEPAASHPLETIEPDRTVGTAVQRMVADGIKHLPVVDGLDVVGIVTLTDVALHHDEIRQEAVDLVGRRRDWAAEDES